MVQFDTVHGKWRECRESADGKSFTVDGKTVTFSEKANIGDVDWKGMGCQMVLECTGNFLTVEKLQPYVAQGIEKVIVSAPMKEGILNVVMGVNCSKITGDMQIITCASCTTNCLAPGKFLEALTKIIINVREGEG